MHPAELTSETQIIDRASSSQILSIGSGGGPIAARARLLGPKVLITITRATNESSLP